MNRFRRLRHTEAIRKLVRETTLTSDDFVQPFFVLEGQDKQEGIESMPGINRYSIDLLLKEVQDYQNKGGIAGILFGIPDQKNSVGSGAYAKGGIVQNALRAIKKEFPDFCIITDICLCQYTDHGHCGVLKDQYVDNDATIALLGKIAASHAEAGADIVAPSDMMDFRVSKIREDLDRGGYINVPIMSYAVKYASAYYGPFRDAVHCTPQFGDRKTYQMDYPNAREALKEAKQDVFEGADIVMVKPALAYLDVISSLKRELNVPIAAYSVSGEFSMIKAAAQKDWVDERDVVMESLTAIKRAGADIIITYYAKQALEWLKD